jgi:hypothetical protein
VSRSLRVAVSDAAVETAFNGGDWVEDKERVVRFRKAVSKAEVDDFRLAFGGLAEPFPWVGSMRKEFCFSVTQLE